MRACVRAYSSRVKRHSVLRWRENRAADCTRIFIRRILRLAERLFAPSSLFPSTPSHFMVCISAIPVLCRYTIRLGVGIRPQRRVGWGFSRSGGSLTHMVLAILICPTRASCLWTFYDIVLIVSAFCPT